MDSVGCGWASCLVWRKQAESYSPVWPRGTPCPKPSPANACTLSWSMDDMLVAAMGARAGWMDRQIDKLVYNNTHTHTLTGGQHSTFEKGENDEQCQPAITATLKLYA